MTYDMYKYNEYNEYNEYKYNDTLFENPLKNILHFRFLNGDVYSIECPKENGDGKDSTIHQQIIRNLCKIIPNPPKFIYQLKIMSIVNGEVTELMTSHSKYDLFSHYFVVIAPDDDIQKTEPIDESMISMILFMEEKLYLIENSITLDTRVEESISLFSYILTSFETFSSHFSVSSPNLIKAIRNRCSKVINDIDLFFYPDLLEICKKLIQKLDINILSHFVHLYEMNVEI